MSSCLFAILFYFTFSLFGMIGLPIARKLFPEKMAAYVAAKPLGLLLFGYLVWFFASFRLLDYRAFSILWILFTAAVFTGAYLARDFFAEFFAKTASGQVFRKKLLLTEGMTLFVYGAYLWIRSHHSAINGTERFMDMAFLTAAGKTNFFPFIDPWYSGKVINYYHYGSHLVSLLSRVSGVPHAVSYNLALGLIYCQTALLTSALTWRIVRSKFFACVAAFLVTTAGTLFFAIRTFQTLLTSEGREYGYASSTRLFNPSYIINEIPSYSFTVGDLHAHLLALPIFLLSLLLLHRIASDDRPRFLPFFLLAVTIASGGMTNAWDFVTAGSLLITVMFLKIFFCRRSPGSKAELTRFGTALGWLGAGLSTLALGVVLMLPYLIHFQSPIAGLGFAPAFVAEYGLKNVQYPTPFSAILGIWGLLLLGSAGAFVANRKSPERPPFLLALGIVSLGILVGVELFFIKDIYSIANPQYFRANTVFKFGYHAWVMLSVLFVVSLHALMSAKPRKQQGLLSGFAKALLVLTVLGGLVYPCQAIRQFYLSSQTARTLDGSTWMKDTAPGDWDTVQYINDFFRQRVVLAEAVGDSYSTFGRITTYTGMTTPIGWTTHEWTWRYQGKGVHHAPGQNVETGWTPILKIAGDIRSLYETQDLDEAWKIIQHYKIQYVYVGDLERTTYAQLNDNKFYLLGRPIFQSGESTLFAVTDEPPLVD